MAARGDDLRRIGDFEALCRYLEDRLGWPLGEYDFDSLTFQYEPDELGLKDEYADAIESIHQLRPVWTDSPGASSSCVSRSGGCPSVCCAAS
jgi:hypothetical protein